MNFIQSYEEIIYNVIDITAGIFLIILIASIILQPVRRSGLGHLFASAILILGGVYSRFFAGTIAALPDDFHGSPVCICCPMPRLTLCWECRLFI